MDPIMQLAIDKANELPYRQHRFRHYAILVDKRGKIISEGANSYNKTHPLFKQVALSIGIESKTYQHAEFAAINKDRSKRGYKLYIARVDRNGIPVLSTPCSVCMEFIRRSKHVKAIEWT